MMLLVPLALAAAFSVAAAATPPRHNVLFILADVRETPAARRRHWRCLRERKPDNRRWPPAASQSHSRCWVKLTAASARCRSAAQDYGWADSGWHRQDAIGRKEVLTPTMDGLIKQGLELDRHYVSLALLSNNHPPQLQQLLVSPRP